MRKRQGYDFSGDEDDALSDVVKNTDSIDMSEYVKREDVLTAIRDYFIQTDGGWNQRDIEKTIMKAGIYCENRFD